MPSRFPNSPRRPPYYPPHLFHHFVYRLPPSILIASLILALQNRAQIFEPLLVLSTALSLHHVEPSPHENPQSPQTASTDKAPNGPPQNAGLTVRTVQLANGYRPSKVVLRIGPFKIVLNRLKC